MKIVYSVKRNGLDPKKRVYICDSCKKTFNWGRSSCWYGSYRDLEESPQTIKYYCCDKCKRR